MKAECDQQAVWAAGLYLCTMQLLLVCYVCGLWVALRLLRRDLPLALLSALAAPLPLAVLVGWRPARAWGLRPFMGCWAFLFGLTLLNFVATLEAVSLPPDDREAYFGWL